MESFVIALREGVEAALIIGIVVAYLRRTGRAHLIGRVWTGLGLAVLASIGAAFVLPPLFRSVINEELYEGILMIAAAALVLTLVIWMARAGKRIKQRIEARVEAASTSRWAEWGVVLMVFVLVFREGAEVVLLLTALSPGTGAIVQLLGGLVGILLAVLFGMGFVRGSARVDLPRFFRVTGAVLIVLVLLLLIGGLHEFAEAGLIPVGPREMAMIGPVVHGNTYVFAGILLVVGALVLLGRRDELSTAEMSNGPVTAKAAEGRKRTWLARVERRWRLALVGMIALFAVVLTGYQVYSQAPAMAAATLVEDSGGKIRISLEDLEDGRLHFYEYGQEERLRFFAIRVESDRYEVCQDACLICGPKGYYQRGPELVCRNCTAPINPSSLGIGGGCNPIPIASVVEDGSLVIATEALQ